MAKKKVVRRKHAAPKKVSPAEPLVPAEPITPCATVTHEIEVERIKPNAWNPNQMTEAKYAEFLAEVHHLGRLPKPVVVRSNCDGFEILDGEHGWRAAKDVGLTTILCEVSEADDFEAMRQTYKRNQHGQHDPVKQGRMFKAMMDERGISRRELANVISVSEATIRNSLHYVQVDEVRNRYAPDLDCEEIARLKVRQIQILRQLPERVAMWFVLAGDVDFTAIGRKGKSLSDAMSFEKTNAVSYFCRDIERYEEQGLLDWLPGDNLPRSIYGLTQLLNKLQEYSKLARRWSVGGITPQQLMPYFDIADACSLTMKWISWTIEAIVDPEHDDRLVLTHEEVGLCMVEMLADETTRDLDDYRNRLRLAIRRKGLHLVEDVDEVEEALQAMDLEAAPEWLRETDMSVGHKHELFREFLPTADEEDVLCLRTMITAGEFKPDRWGDVTNCAKNAIDNYRSVMASKENADEAGGDCEALAKTIAEAWYAGDDEAEHRAVLIPKLAAFEFHELRLLLLAQQIGVHFLQRRFEFEQELEETFRKLDEERNERLKAIMADD